MIFSTNAKSTWHPSKPGIGSKLNIPILVEKSASKMRSWLIEPVWVISEVTLYIPTGPDNCPIVLAESVINFPKVVKSTMPLF